VRKKIKDSRFSYPQPITLEADEIIRNLITVDPFARMTATQVLESSWLKEENININICIDILDEIEDSY
jgi:serine/threonine protein kinase